MSCQSAEFEDLYLVLSFLQPYSWTVKTLLWPDVPVPSKQFIVDPNVASSGFGHIKIGISCFLQLEASSFEDRPISDRIHFLRIEDTCLVK